MLTCCAVGIDRCRRGLSSAAIRAIRVFQLFEPGRVSLFVAAGGKALAHWPRRNDVFRPFLRLVAGFDIVRGRCLCHTIARFPFDCACVCVVSVFSQYRKTQRRGEDVYPNSSNSAARGGYSSCTLADSRNCAEEQGALCSSDTYSSRSPGWQSRQLQTASSVEKRIDFTLLVFKRDIFVMVIPTLLAKVFNGTLRSAMISSSFMTIAMLPRYQNVQTLLYDRIESF